jgi:hypothetical protein
MGQIPCGVKKFDKAARERDGFVVDGPDRLIAAPRARIERDNLRPLCPDALSYDRVGHCSRPGSSYGRTRQDCRKALPRFGGPVPMEFPS